MKIAVINRSGNTGKTTLTKHLLCSQIPDAKRISIEDVNAGDGPVDLEIGAEQFKQLAAEIAVRRRASFVIDIGASNAKAMLSEFGVLKRTAGQIDYWVIPFAPADKQLEDTLRTIQDLVKLDVAPSKIVVIPNLVEDVAGLGKTAAVLSAAASEIGFHLCRQGVLTNQIFSEIRGDAENIFDLAAKNDSNWDAQIDALEAAGDDEGLAALGVEMVRCECAADAAQNLRAVLAATPIGAALAMAEAA